MTHRLRPSLHTPQEIFTSLGYAHAQLRRPLGCVLGLVAVCSRGIVELRVTTAPVAAQVVQMCHQWLVRGKKLCGLHDWEAAPRTTMASHALVTNRARDAKALNVTPDGHGPHVRSVRVLGDEVPSLGHLECRRESSKIRETG